MHSKTFQLPIISREEDVQAIESTLSRIAGVKQVEGHRETKIFAVVWDDPATWEDIEHTLMRMGYTLKQK